MNVEKHPSGNSAGEPAAAGPDGGEVDEADRQAFAMHAGQQREGAKPGSQDAPSLTNLPPEIRGHIMQQTMTAAPDPRSQAAAFRDAGNLGKASPAYSSLVADPSKGPGRQFQELRSSTNAQRAREEFRGHVNDLNAVTDKGERQQKIQTIHDAAIQEYRNPDASLSSIESARLGDRAAEKANYKDLSPLKQLRQSPTANAAKRALDSTDRTPNASMTGEVLQSDPRTQQLMSRGKPVGHGSLWSHMGRDPNFSHNPWHTPRFSPDQTSLTSGSNLTPTGRQIPDRRSGSSRDRQRMATCRRIPTGVSRASEALDDGLGFHKSTRRRQGARSRPARRTSTGGSSVGPTVRREV